MNYEQWRKEKLYTRHGIWILGREEGGRMLYNDYNGSDVCHPLRPGRRLPSRRGMLRPSR